MSKTSGIRRLLAFAERERRQVLAELSRVKGLMPLLMKRRNRGKWTPEERVEIRTHLRRLRSISPYVAALLLPGGLAALPAVAWWLDRRRKRRDSAAGPVQTGPGTEAVTVKPPET